VVIETWKGLKAKRREQGATDQKDRRDEGKGRENSSGRGFLEYAVQGGDEIKHFSRRPERFGGDERFCRNLRETKEGADKK